MTRLDPEVLRPHLDLEGKYVDFGMLRTSLTVERIVRDLEVNLSKPKEDGECRAGCPKCKKERSFALNINTNRFNCFAKGCMLKGGGVIDFTAKFFEVSAKEASHLVACAYGIQPYSQAPVSESHAPEIAVSATSPSGDLPQRAVEAVNREEFDALTRKVERLSTIVWSLLFEQGQINESTSEIFDKETSYEFESTTTG